MEKSPFDGWLFHLNNFTWEVWGAKKFATGAAPTADRRPESGARSGDSRRTSPDQYDPGKLDWFDDHAAVVGNARLAAEIARDGKCKGILLDSEAYDGPLFDYRRQRDAATKTWEAYAARFGPWPDVMTVIPGGYPG
jgi:hypothetical protein